LQTHIIKSEIPIKNKLKSLLFYIKRGDEYFREDGIIPQNQSLIDLLEEKKQVIKLENPIKFKPGTKAWVDNKGSMYTNNNLHSFKKPLEKIEEITLNQ